MYIHAQAVLPDNPKIERWSRGSLGACCDCDFWSLMCRRGRDRILELFGAPLFGRSALRMVDDHHARDKFLNAVCVKIDWGTVGIRFGNYSQAVLKVLDIRAFFECFQVASSGGTRLAFPGDLQLQQKSQKQTGWILSGRVVTKKWPASVNLQAFKFLKVYKSNNFNPILARENGPA
jgi:hypothetical protein